MHDQSHGPIQSLVLGKGAVSTLVCQNPNTGKDESLHGGVCYPAESAKVWGGEVWNVGFGEIDEGRGVEEVADDVCH